MCFSQKGEKSSQLNYLSVMKATFDPHELSGLCPQRSQPEKVIHVHKFLFCCIFKRHRLPVSSGHGRLKVNSDDDADDDDGFPVSFSLLTLGLTFVGQVHFH